MNILSIVKHAVGVSTSVGSGILVTNIAKAFLPPEQKILSKIATTTATVVLGSMLGDAAATYTDKVFTDVKKAVQESNEVLRTEANKDEKDAQ